jgi:trigger factor
MDPNSFAKAVDEAGQVPAMVGEVARRKALAAALAKAKVSDASGNLIDLQALLGPEVEMEEIEDDEDGEDDDSGVVSVPTGSAAAAAAAPAIVADPTALPVSDLGGFEPDEK